MDGSSINIIDIEILERTIIEKLLTNIGNVIVVLLFIIALFIVKYILQSEMKGSCPYCGKEFLLRKQHHDKVCLVCKKEFRLRNMRIYKGEDVVDELLYYITKAFACLATMSGNITEEQKRHVEEFGMSQNITRRQFQDIHRIYDKTLKQSQRINFVYRGIVDRLKLYIEDFYSDKQMFELENTENTLLNILYNFAMIDGTFSDGEKKFFRYFNKIFNISEDRFTLVINHNYESPKAKVTDREEKENTSNTSYTHDNNYQQNNTQENKNTAYNTKSQEYYKILECESNISDEELKKQYKKLMMQYHPDKYASNDLPEEIEKMLNNKMSELNEAYEYIKKERGMN